MKVFILTLLVFNTMCFALGDEEKNFISLDEGNEQPAMKADVEANDFVEDANQNVSRAPAPIWGFISLVKKILSLNKIEHVHISFKKTTLNVLTPEITTE